MVTMYKALQAPSYGTMMGTMWLEQQIFSQAQMEVTRIFSLPLQIKCILEHTHRLQDMNPMF